MLTKYNRRTVATDSGEIIPHATVSFYWQFGGLPATVYADPDGVTPLGASVQSDPQGRIGVFLYAGYYRIVVTLGGEILDELTYEPIVSELAVTVGSTFVIRLAEMEAPAVNSYLRTLPSGFSEWRTPAQVKTDLALDQVSNTSDANKPVSNATQTALNGKINATEKGAANGVATLNASGQVPAAQLPSFVDDVLEVANYAALPGTGESGKIYITANTNRQYRWSGSAYAEMVASPGSTDAITEGSVNLYFTQARVRTTPLTGYTVGANTTLASTDTILAALGKVQGQLNGKATSAQGAKADTALQPGANLSALTNDTGLISQEAGDTRYTRRSQNLADLDNATTARTNLGLGTAAVANVTTSATDTTSGRVWQTNDLVKTTSATDSNAGRMLKVGDFGVGTFGVNHDSANTLLGYGSGFFAGNGAIADSSWAPGGEYYPLLNMYRGTNNVSQINFNASAMFYRVKSSGSIPSWRTLWDNANLTGAATSILTSNLTANRVLVSDGFGKVAASGVSVTDFAPATVEQNTRNASYTIALTDNNKHIYHSNTSAYTWTIPPNSSVAFPIGATVTFVNDGSGNITIAQGSGVTIVLAGSGTTGNRTLAQFGMLTALKVGTDRWFLSGTGVS